MMLGRGEATQIADGIGTRLRFREARAGEMLWPVDDLCRYASVTTFIRPKKGRTAGAAMIAGGHDIAPAPKIAARSFARARKKG